MTEKPIEILQLYLFPPIIFFILKSLSSLIVFVTECYLIVHVNV